MNQKGVTLTLCQLDNLKFKGQKEGFCKMQTDFWKKKYEGAIVAFAAAQNHHEAQYPIACHGIRAGIPESQIRADLIMCQEKYGKKKTVDLDEIDRTISSARSHAWDGHDRTGYTSSRTCASYFPVSPKQNKALLEEAIATRQGVLIDVLKESVKDVSDPFTALSERPENVRNVKGMEALKHLYSPNDYVYIGAIDGTPKKWRGQIGYKPIKTIREWSEWENINEYLADDNTAFYAINPLKDSLSKKSHNVLDYRYILIEMDARTIEEQARIIIALMRAGLPIVSVVKSGNKSLHALLKIDGINTTVDYKKMAEEIIKNRLSAIGADPACSNPDRMSRIHGAVIDDKAKGITRHQDVVYLLEDAETQSGITMDEAIEVLDKMGFTPVSSEKAEKEMESTMEKESTGTAKHIPWIITIPKTTQTPDGKTITKNVVDYDLDRLVAWLVGQGFCQEETATMTENPRYIRVQGNVYDAYNLTRIQTFIFSFVRENGSASERKMVLDKRKSIDEPLLRNLPVRKINMLKDTGKKVNIPYANGMLQITATSVALTDYDKIDGMIARSAILARKYLPGVSPAGCDFDRFLSLIMGEDKGRKEAICSALGYLVSRYKDEDCAKAVLLTDLSVDDNHGRTGKGLLYKALSKVRPNGVMIDGKTQKNESDVRFRFSSVTPETEIIHFNDLPKGFDIESLFPCITEAMNTQGKSKDVKGIPFADSPKMLLTTNYWVKGVAPSFRARIEVYELSNYFTAEKTPKMEFGHLFFGSDWSEEEWNKFDATMVTCVQTYLQHGLITPKASAESDIKRIRTECGEAFVDWVTDNMPKTDGTFVPNSFFDDFFLPKEPTKAEKTKIKKTMRTYAELTGLIFKEEQKKDGDRERGFSLQKKAPAPAPTQAVPPTVTPFIPFVPAVAPAPAQATQDTPTLLSMLPEAVNENEYSEDAKRYSRETGCPLEKLAKNFSFEAPF